MTVNKLNTLHASDPESNPDRYAPQGELGWEGHVHFSKNVPLWKRVLETWPELRTGISYSLIFTSGVLLGGAIMAMMGTPKDRQEHL